jgi:hypothetical protein
MAFRRSHFLLKAFVNRVSLRIDVLIHNITPLPRTVGVSGHFEIDNHFQLEHNQVAEYSRLRRAEK